MTQTEFEVVSSFYEEKKLFVQMLKGFVLSWFIVNFEPIQTQIIRPIKNWVTDNLFIRKTKCCDGECSEEKLNYLAVIANYITQALSCHKCLALYITFCFTMDIYAAIFASMMAYCLDKYMSSLKTYL